MRVFDQKKTACLLLSCLFAFLPVIIAVGCNQGDEPVLVNFSKTVPIPHPTETAASKEVLRVAVAAMISPKETFGYYQDLLAYLGDRTGKRVSLVQRKTYAEINELLQKGLVDIAFICSGPYASGKTLYGLKILAVPQIRGSTFYQSYLIVNKNSPYQTLEDLRGKVFAFTDPESNTGKLVPAFWLSQMGENPDGFFGKIIYTYSHDNSILAVSRGLVDGAAVDSLIWDYYDKVNGALTSRTRIIKKSKLFGIPPLVSSPQLSETLENEIRNLLYSMHLTSKGKSILDGLMIERFVPSQEEWYDPIRAMQQESRRGKNGKDPTA